jgi:hypothetical protein
MKLHLGCGQKYFEGYINVDHPPSEHTVMAETVADEFKDLLEMNYSHSSVDEIRLHHVFEHFPRATACALLASWNSWLVMGGVLRIEVPDFFKTAKSIFNPFVSDTKKSVALRHIFGSQEANWAVHYDGYTKQNLTIFLGLFGYQPVEFLFNSWGATHNIEVKAKKISELDLDLSFNASKAYLSRFMVDNSLSEQAQLSTWLDSFNLQMAKSFAKPF